MTPTATSGTAQSQGPLWGSRPPIGPRSRRSRRPPTRKPSAGWGSEPGDAVLDLGCGAGTFLGLAADRGARGRRARRRREPVEIARERVPDADLRLGDLESLPWADDSFDLVTGFYSFFFAGDMVAALREAGRVAKPGAPVVIQVWGRPERCDLAACSTRSGPLARGGARGADRWPSRGCSRASPREAGLEPALRLRPVLRVRVRRRGDARPRSSCRRAGLSWPSPRRGRSEYGAPSPTRSHRSAARRLVPARERMALPDRAGVVTAPARLIVGAGPAGLTTAIALARAGVDACWSNAGPSSPACPGHLGQRANDGDPPRLGPRGRGPGGRARGRVADVGVRDAGRGRVRVRHRRGDSVARGERAGEPDRGGLRASGPLEAVLLRYLRSLPAASVELGTEVVALEREPMASR